MLKDEFVKRLLRWGRNHQRKFPWRETKNPFRILIAEMMLQKTNAEKVAKIYPGFIIKYKTPYILARANVRALKKELHYLGIHARAKRMKLAATIIEKEFNGKVPQNREALLSLPGVGPYVANAVLCFAFNEDVSLVDTNVVNILKKFLHIKSKQKRPRNDQKLWLMMERMIPRDRGKLFNRSIIDLSAYIKKNKNIPI